MFSNGEPSWLRMLILELFLDKVIKYFLDQKLNVKSVFDTANNYKSGIALAYLGKPCEVFQENILLQYQNNF